MTHSQGRVVRSCVKTTPRISAKFEFRYESLESEFSSILFSYNLMIGYSKKNRKIIQESAFHKKIKNPGLKFNPGLAHPRRPRGSQSGRKKRRNKSFQVRAKEPLGTDSHRTISKNSSGCRLLIGHKKMLCIIVSNRRTVSPEFFS